MVLTIQQIIDILKTGNYPGNLENLQIRAGDRAFHLYPSMEVTVPQPQSPVTTPEIITKEEAFNVTIFIRFTRPLQTEYDDLNGAELEVLSVLKAQPLQGGLFFFQTEVWNRTQTKDVHGVESSIRVLFREITPLVTDTTVGAGGTLNLDGGAVILNLIGLQSSDDGRNVSDQWQDDAKRFPIPDGNIGSRTFEYAWTKTLFNSVQAFIDVGGYIIAIFTDGGFTQTFTVLPIRQREQVSFAGLKTAVLQVEVQG